MSQEKASGKSRGYRNKKKVNIGDKGREVVENIKEDNLVLQLFGAYATELDDRHDRYERIVKIGRDITIESKRIIFLLHSIDKKSKQESVLAEAESRLRAVAENNFKAIARELEGQDPYFYLKAYRNGSEEYVEALTFFQYLSNSDMGGWVELKNALSYIDSEKGEAKSFQALVTPSEYILGIADLTGELMRQCINNLALGESASCYQTRNFVRNVYKGFLGCSNSSSKEINRKVFTLKQSLQKIENVCYTIKVRGSEIPKHILVDVAIEDIESDEGYQPY
ncbi:translin-associated protein X [Ceratina calcarata]|uniref:Translin-associated protein X n=1 Tax=Ceratina calcarata TaxID=156304 RepID=A0AAJ7NDP6_9HYME|nr:translin-associated protein X [Ceratina calcarata]